MSEDAKAKATTLFGRVIHSAEEWKAIEDEKARLHRLLVERARELEQLTQKHDALANRLEGAQQALEEERARRARADREFAANLSELETRRKEDARAAAAARERDAEKVEALEKENAASATSLKDATTGLAAALRDRDALRKKLEASEVEASSAAARIETLEKCAEELRAQGALHEQQLVRAAAHVKAARASMAARAALAGRLVGGIAELTTVLLGAGARTFWRRSTGKRGANLTPGDLSALLEALGVSTEVGFELEQGGAGVLRFVAPAGADTPAWALAITEAVLFHQTARSYAAPVMRSENGKVQARFEPLED